VLQEVIVGETYESYSPNVKRAAQQFVRNVVFASFYHVDDERGEPLYG